MNTQPVKQEFRWSIRKKGKNVLNMCAHLFFYSGLILSMLAGASTTANANPTDGTVISGAATMTSTATELTVNQSSARAIIDWKSFDIANGETTKFIQPGASSVALNRVVNSAQASAINGNLFANGHVLVINPNGVVIGTTGNVDVNGFIASTADIDNASFMNSTGTLNFDHAGNAGAVVENRGHITVGNAGLGLLVAPTVGNSGVIEGNLARIQMGAGDTFGVDLYGDGLIQLAVGKSAKLVAENTGSLVTDGGKVLMTAAAASSVVESVINNSGVIEARGLVNNNGEIVLTGAGAHVTVSGKVDASGANSGGSIKIGGDYQGGGTLAHAATTHIASGAVLDASATDNGNGGTIVVWADDKTIFQGAALAMGGANGGNGGLIETSSKDYLEVSGTVDASAANGQAGTWLLDPRSLEITSSTDDIDGTGASGTPWKPNSSGSDVSQLKVSTLLAALTGGSNVFITTNVVANAFLGGDGDILIDTSINRTSAGTATLTLQAYDDIKFTGGSGISSTGGALNLVMQSGLGLGSDGGDITLDRAISTNGGYLDVTADQNFTVSAAISTNGGNLTATAVNDITVGAAITTGAGAVSLTSTGSDIAVNGNITSTAGNIEIKASDDVTNASGAIATAGAGTITITGSTGSGTGNVTVNKLTAQNGNIFVITDNNASITVKGKLETTGTGNITLTSGTGNITTAGGNFIANSGGNLTLSNNLTTEDGTAYTEDGYVDIDASGFINVKNISTTGGGTDTLAAPHSIDLKTVNGSITAGDLTVNNTAVECNDGGGFSTVNIDAKTTLTTGNISVINLDNADSPYYSAATATLKANGNIGTGTITVTATDTNQGNFDSNATLDVTSVNGNISTGGVTVTAFSDKASTGSGVNAPADAKAKMTADNGSITITSGGIVVTSTAKYAGSSNDYTTEANATIDLHSQDALTINGVVSSTATAQANQKDKANALTKIISTDGDVILSGGANPPKAQAGDGTGSGADAIATETYTGALIDTTVATESGAVTDTARLIVSGVHYLNVAVTPGQGKVYGDADPAPLAYTASGPVLGSFTGALTREAGEPVGLYDIYIGGLKVNSTTYSNYKLTLTGGTDAFSITPALLTVAIKNATREYGLLNPDFDATVTGWKFNDAALDLIDGDLVTTATQASNIGHYAITAQNVVLLSSNYTVAPITPGDLHITPAFLTINAVHDSKDYDGNTSSDEMVQVIGLRNGDAVKGPGLGDTVTGLVQKFDSENAGPRTLSVLSGFTVNDGNNGKNYIVSSVNPHSGVIDQATLRIFATEDEKTYDGTTASNKTPTYTGLADGDSLTGLDQVFDEKNAGGRTMLVLETGFTLDDGYEGGDNYKVFFEDADGYINKAPLTLTGLSAEGKIYDGNTDATILTEGADLDGETFDEIDFEGGTGTFEDKNVGIGKHVFLSGFHLTGDESGNYELNLPKYLTADITKAPLVLRAQYDEKTYDGTTASYDGSPVGEGLVEGDELDYATQVFDSRNAGPRITKVVQDGFEIIDEDYEDMSGNYDISFADGTGLIKKASLDVRGLSAKDKVYDGNTAATILTEGADLYGVLSHEIENGDGYDVIVDDVSLNGGTGEFDTKNVGFYKPVTVLNLALEGIDAGNYELNLPEYLTANITPAPLTITANDDDKTFDGIPYSGGNGVTYDGFVGGEDESVLNWTPEYFGSSQGAVNVGKYVISLIPDNEGNQERFSEFYDDEMPGNYDSNYDITYVDGTLSIDPTPNFPTFSLDPLGRPIISFANQTITLDAPFEPVEVRTLNADVSIGGRSANALARLEPAAGGNSAEDLANIEPAAGGDGGARSGGDDIACGNDFLNNRPCKNIQ